MRVNYTVQFVYKLKLKLSAFDIPTSTENSEIMADNSFSRCLIKKLTQTKPPSKQNYPIQMVTTKAQLKAGSHGFLSHYETGSNSHSRYHNITLKPKLVCHNR